MSRDNPFENAARGRDASGINEDELTPSATEYEKAEAAIDKALYDPQGIMLHSWEHVRRAWRFIKQHLAIIITEREWLMAENERLSRSLDLACEMVWQIEGSVEMSAAEWAAHFRVQALAEAMKEADHE